MASRRAAKSTAASSLALNGSSGRPSSSAPILREGRPRSCIGGRFNFLREAQIWYQRDLDQTVLSDEFENVIVLSDEFYAEITAHPIPTDLEVVKVFAAAPAVLDLFMWLAYRCFIAKGAERVPAVRPARAH